MHRIVHPCPQPAPVLDVVSGGEPASIGEAIGASMEPKIRAAREMLPQVENFSAYRPWWMPFGLYLSLTQWKAARLIGPSTHCHYPEMELRLKAMASAAKTSVETLYLFHWLETVSNPTEDRVLAPAMAGCSALAVEDCTDHESGPLLAHNFDMIPISRELLVLRRIKEKHSFESLQFSYAPLGGAIDGINECGLAISYNFAAVCDTHLEHPPLSFAIDQALGRCRDVEEAIRFITSKPRSGGALLMLADAAGNVASLEIAPSCHKVRSANRHGMIWHTNDFATSPMRKLEPSRSSVFGDRCPPALRGRMAYQSSERRYEKFSQFAKRQTSVSNSSVDRIMCDHGDSSSGDDDSICMHGAYWSTIASIRMYPRSRRIRLTYDHPCVGVYSEFAL